MGTASIDPGSSIPKYSQLREILLDLIESELAYDQVIPSERELVDRYELSRMTVRQAINNLVAEGRLYRVPGKGTFVARPKIEMPLRLDSFTEDMRARGLEPGAVDLERRLAPATGQLLRALSLNPGDTVHVITRLRTADSMPMALERSYVPTQVAPGLEIIPLADRSLYQVLEERFGIVLERGEQTIEAGIVDIADAALLDLRPGSAVLRLRRRSFAGGRPVEFTVSTYRGDRYQLQVGLALPRPMAQPDGDGNGQG
ncbi:MAG TPA: GntR family transcriptional regulator [Candidatus Binatia bacterium]|nr:GntR family transcriptional regulator [Candidatus Binatia bacterium]